MKFGWYCYIGRTLQIKLVQARTTILFTTDQLIPKIIENVKEDIKNNREKTNYYCDKSTKYTRPHEKGETVIVQLQLDKSGEKV